VIKLQGVHRAYREGDQLHEVLVDVDAHIAAGEWVSLLGPSGSGKSTLLNLISGIDAPDQGRIVIAGTDVAALSERERTVFRREHIGFVFQFFNLLPTLTVEENLRLPLELAQGRAGSAAARKRVVALLERVGLADRRGTRPDRLSGGERQRVAIARALIHRPQVVLADEPTGNLDAETGGRAVALLDELVRDEGATMVVVTHSPELAAHGDRILELKGGGLYERSP